MAQGELSTRMHEEDAKAEAHQSAELSRLRSIRDPEMVCATGAAQTSVEEGLAQALSHSGLLLWNSYIRCFLLQEVWRETSYF
mmetsp:Transcript_95771/g.169584  ORF Transcript_95771/g.169584 Transcript_95771/m.169584 type:complete len:83 (+) Transcript_95771:59-307(+)